MAAIYWLIAFVILVGIEIMTTALTTIWFAGGAALAFVAPSLARRFRSSCWYLW